jgi:hypothetical protein
MRQEHRAGEKLFVNFACQTLPIVDPTGVTSQAQLVHSGAKQRKARPTWSSWLQEHGPTR